MSKKSNNRSIISGNFKSYDTAYLVKCTNSPIRTIELTGRYKKKYEGTKRKKNVQGCKNWTAHRGIRLPRDLLPFGIDMAGEATADPSPCLGT